MMDLFWAMPSAPALALRVGPISVVSAVPASVPNAVTICEQFIGRVLVRREVTEEVAPTSTWHRLKHTPVVVIDPIEGCKSDEYALDVDCAGDGWVRIAKRTSRSAVVRYTVGMAEALESIPVPLLEGIRRLDRHLAESPDEPPPAAVTALWRPYRRMRLS